MTLAAGAQENVTVVFGNNASGSRATGLNFNFSGGACISAQPGSSDSSDLNGGVNRSLSVIVTGNSAGSCSFRTQFSASNANTVSVDTSFTVVNTALNQPALAAIATATATSTATATAEPTATVALTAIPTDQPTAEPKATLEPTLPVIGQSSGLPPMSGGQMLWLLAGGLAILLSGLRGRTILPLNVA